MKNLKIKLSAFVLFAIAIFMVTFTSCQKDTKILSPKLNNDHSNYLRESVEVPILGVIIDYGTRKGAKKNREHDELWGTNFDNGNTCQRKGMCLHTANSIEMSDSSGIVINGDDVIEGGLLPDNGQSISEGSGRWNISRDSNGAYFVEIGQNDILPTTKQTQFGDGYFYQEFDYILPTFISDSFDVEEIILHSGNHPITEDQNGTIKFYL